MLTPWFKEHRRNFICVEVKLRFADHILKKVNEMKRIDEFMNKSERYKSDSYKNKRIITNTSNKKRIKIHSNKENEINNLHYLKIEVVKIYVKNRPTRENKINNKTPTTKKK